MTTSWSTKSRLVFIRGVRNKEYEYERPESRERAGKLYWDVTDMSVTRESLLAGMDFPLVSVAMSYDIVNRLYTRMEGTMDALGLYGLF